MTRLQGHVEARRNVVLSVVLRVGRVERVLPRRRCRYDEKGEVRRQTPSGDLGGSGKQILMQRIHLFRRRLFFKRCAGLQIGHFCSKYNTIERISIGDGGGLLRERGWDILLVARVISEPGDE